jgi:hypothetical protein
LDLLFQIYRRILKYEKRTKMDGTPLVFCGVHVAQSLVFCVVFCRSLFFLFPFGHGIVCLLATVLSVPFSIYSFKLLEPSIFSLSKLAIFYVINCSRLLWVVGYLVFKRNRSFKDIAKFIFWTSAVIQEWLYWFSCYKVYSVFTFIFCLMYL